MNKVNKNLISDQSGFTVIELLISSIVFTLILLVTTYGIIQITRGYIKGSVSAQVQNNNRSLVDEITQNIQLSSSSSVNPGPNVPANWKSFFPTYWFCVNGVRYIYQFNNPQPYALTEDSHGISCLSPQADPPSAGTGEKSLLNSNTQLLRPTGGGSQLIYTIGSSGLYGVTLDLLFGGPSTYVINSGKYTCRSISLGGSFCNNSTITTAVGIRSGIQ